MEVQTLYHKLEVILFIDNKHAIKDDLLVWQRITNRQPSKLHKQKSCHMK